MTIDERIKEKMTCKKIYKHWYTHKPNELWIKSGQHYNVCCYVEYNKKYPHLSGKREIASFNYLEDAKLFIKAKTKQTNIEIYEY